MIKIAFVCTGNTCRSVMAERILKKLSDQDKSIKVSSRGIYATGENISPMAKKVLKSHHISAANRKSVKLGKIDKNTLYVVMNNQMKKCIPGGKVISFEDLMAEPIADPYGKDEQAYQLTFDQLSMGIKILLEKIKKWREI